MLHLLKKKPSRKNKFTPAIFTQQAFNPLNSPNTVALWDGVNFGNPVADKWVDDVSGNIIDCTASLTLPISNGLLNGFKTVIFNGIDQYGLTNIPAGLNPFSMYIVLRQITWTNQRCLFSSGSGGLFPFYQNNLSPEIAIDGADVGVNTSNELILNTWSIVSLTSTDIIGTCRINLNSNFLTGRLSIIGYDGICLGTDSAGSFLNANCEFAYIIMRDVADNTFIQNNFINWLKNRFAI